jgi:hypothetical protein
VGKDTPVTTTDDPLQDRPASARKIITREAGLLLGLFLLGLVVLPIAVYSVGQAIFGDYGGGSYGHFYSQLSGRIRAADPAAWFLVMSPYLALQTLRLIALGWRTAGRRPAPGSR